MADIFRDESVYRRVPRGTEESGVAADAGITGGSSAQKEQIKPEFSWKYILYVLKKGFVRYFIDAFTGMAQGLFCTLIAGTILGQARTPRSSSAGESPPLPTSQRCSWARA